MNNGERMETVLKSLPYADQIRDIDMSKDDEIRFTWRGARYKVADDLFVEEVGNGVLIGSDLSILMRALLTRSRLLSTL